MKIFKKIAFFVLPLVIFVALYIPYSFINSTLIVGWLGCGCNTGFNANDFTRLFWIVASIGTTAIFFGFSKKHFGKIGVRILYAVCVLVITLGLSIPFCQSMMWR